MIKVNLIYESSELVGLELTGHAHSAAYNKDLVCAAVSAIVTGGFNAFNDEDIKSISLDEGYAKVIINSKNGLSILNVIIVQLKTIEQKYPKNIKIK